MVCLKGNMDLKMDLTPIRAESTPRPSQIVEVASFLKRIGVTAQLVDKAVSIELKSKI